MSHEQKLFTSGIKYTGPGTWHIIHTKAFLAKGDELKRHFIHFMKNEIQPNLNCAECREHCYSYISSTNMEDYINKKDKDGNDIGLFFWTWEFHNAVNKRINKQQISWDDAYDYFNTQNIKVCTVGCDETVKISKKMNMKIKKRED
jgi:hypothetical protein